MGRILDPSTDATSFNGIKDLVNITATAADINNSPLFLRAESYILTRVPTAELPGGRSLSSRNDIILALQLLAASYFLLGGGTVATTSSTSTATGPTESITESIGSVSKTVQYASSQRVNPNNISEGISIEDRSRWYERQAMEILERLSNTATLESLSYVGTIVGR